MMFLSSGFGIGSWEGLSLRGNAIERYGKKISAMQLTAKM